MVRHTKRFVVDDASKLTVIARELSTMSLKFHVCFCKWQNTRSFIMVYAQSEDSGTVDLVEMYLYSCICVYGREVGPI